MSVPVHREHVWEVLKESQRLPGNRRRGVAAPAGVAEAVAVLTAAGRALLGRGPGGPAEGLGGPG